jgi:hypothetical protein
MPPSLFRTVNLIPGVIAGWSYVIAAIEGIGSYPSHHHNCTLFYARWFPCLNPVLANFHIAVSSIAINNGFVNIHSKMQSNCDMASFMDSDFP